MAHDFTAMARDEHGATVMAFFFGYGNGFLYQAFDACEHNMGISGDGARIEIAEDEMRAGLCRAEGMWSDLSYPDPSRFDDIAEFKARFDAGRLEGPFAVRFS